MTLAAIKVLHTYFAADRKLWTLVDKKARKFVAQTAGFDKNALQTVLDAFNP